MTGELLFTGFFMPFCFLTIWKRYPLHSSVQVKGIFIGHPRNKIHQTPEHGIGIYRGAPALQRKVLGKQAQDTFLVRSC